MIGRDIVKVEIFMLIEKLINALPLVPARPINPKMYLFFYKRISNFRQHFQKPIGVPFRTSNNTMATVPFP